MKSNIKILRQSINSTCKSMWRSPYTAAVTLTVRETEIVSSIMVSRSQQNIKLRSLLLCLNQQNTNWSQTPANGAV